MPVAGAGAGAGAGQSYALLADGTTLTIRPADSGDYELVRRLHADMSPDNLYLRFFSMSRLAAEQEARRVTRDPGPDHGVLLGLLGDDLAGVASYELIPGTGTAEIAFAVADGLHGRGIATLLLEHLVSLGHARGVRSLTAEALPENSAMLRVFADAGLTVRRRSGEGVIQLAMRIPAWAALGEASAYLDAVADREQHADLVSLEPLLAPRTVAVAGPITSPGSIGRRILLNIRDSGFAGALHAVTTEAASLEGIPCAASVAALPEPPDLVIVTVPAERVLDVVQDCARRGARSLLVTTQGLTLAQEAALLQASRRGGMRVVGPGSFGVAVPGMRLNATSATHCPSPGRAGLAVQSGGLGAALLAQLSRLGLGTSSFVSVGGGLDVSGTDLLMWWESDDTTELAVLYLESFGSPRWFARTARRVGARIPILTVHAGWSAPGQRAAFSHTAAAAAPLIARQALFEQAGVIATTSFSELLDAAALMASQPVPAGSRIAIVGNGGGAGVLAADACAQAGLTVATPGRETRRRLRDVLPPGSAVGGPVDTTAALTAEAFRAALDIAASEDGVDAVLALVVQNGSADLIPALTATRLPVPVAAVVLDQPESVRLLPDGEGVPAVPAYASPEAAAWALARAARYGAWRSRPAGTVPEFSDLRVADADAIMDSFLARMPGGGWLSAEEADSLLRCFGIPMVEFRRAEGTDAAIAAAARFGGHVALKADVPGLLHKSQAGAVQLGLHGAGEVRQAMDRLAGTFGAQLTGVLVEPMISGGVEVIIGVAQEPVFGPVVVFGLGGIATDVLGDHVARLAPLTESDAGDLIASIRAAPLLLGLAGQPAADIPALRDTLLRVSQLADHLPQVAELDLNPVIARPDGVVAVDARIRVSSHRPADPYLRQLSPRQDGP